MRQEKPTDDFVSIAQAKGTLPKLVHRVEAGSPVTLTRRGKPVAVLISCADLERIEGRRSRFEASYTELRRRFDLPGLDIDPEPIFERSPDPSGGRQPDFE